MWGLAGYVAEGSKLKRKGGNTLVAAKGVGGPDTHRIAAGGGPKDIPRSRTRQQIAKERAQLARDQLQYQRDEADGRG